jgi:hypothetical protein
LNKETASARIVGRVQPATVMMLIEKAGRELLGGGRGGGVGGLPDLLRAVADEATIRM